MRRAGAQVNRVSRPHLVHGCRDLADGCILAEILSKYLPKDVQLHAFERATSTQRKKGNWKLLAKIFKVSVSTS